MKHRYQSWVEGLNVDWNISRQRFFGVPFPLWYPTDAANNVDFDSPILAALADLPVDPSSDVPAGYQESQRNQPLGFVGDPDVMDTWATSSLSPWIAGHWGTDLFERVFPMDLRPQAHEIIRTWLFSTVVRSHFEFGALPFANALISGWVLDPERKKMSKSLGNVTTPMPLLEAHGADALRYWAASGRPGVDTALDEAQMKIGRRLSIKLLNVSKFVLGRLEGSASFSVADVTEALDRDVLALLGQLIAECTTTFANYDYARALERTESFFWSFCDDYVELVKIRAYGGTDSSATASARATLAIVLSALQRLFAPILPFVTDEVWSWWHEGSIHHAPWPREAELDGLAVPDEPGRLYRSVGEVLEAIRREKSEAKLSQRAAVQLVQARGPESWVAAIRVAESDLQDAGTVEAFEYAETADVAVSVTLEAS
jgi:valyl-tRNA synthetase